MILSLKPRFKQMDTPLPQPVAKISQKTQMHLGVPHHIPHPGPQLGHQHLTSLRLGIV